MDDYLKIAKGRLQTPGSDGRTDEQLALDAIALALIAICERLDRLIECQVVNVPIVGTVSDGGKVTIWEDNDEPVSAT